MSETTTPLQLDNLPRKQREVLEQILLFLQEQGYPPSIHQLCERCGVRSTSTIHHHLSALKRKGFIHWNPSERRALTVRANLMDAVLNHDLSDLPADLPATRTIYAKRSSEIQPPSAEISILGTIAAGSPLQTLSDTTQTLCVTDVFCPPGCYALRVKGQSMIEDHIMEGDIVIVNPKAPVRDGDVVVALVENHAATLKRIYREQEGVRLQPANASMEPIWTRDVQVQGKVEAIMRKVF